MGEMRNLFENTEMKRPCEKESVGERSMFK
jgi:hypothetical protein